MNEQSKKIHTLLYASSASILVLLVSNFYFFVIQGEGSALVQADAYQVSGVVLSQLTVPSTEIQKQSAHVLFVGDMFFDRHIREVALAKGGDALFSCIDPLFAGSDFVVGNLEGPITTNASVSLGSVVGSANNYRFTFPPATASLLLAHHVQAVSLGNNHIYNFGQSGITQTHAYLDGAGVGYFGGVSGDEPVYRTEDAGVSLSFVGYNQFGGSSPAKVALTIFSERAAGRVVIVFAHWGTEYSTTTRETRPVATLFAESGAAAIIGSHPHVVGVHEYIGDTLVYYSLGNFIFDQYFSDAVMHGLAVGLTIPESGKVTAIEYPTVLGRDGRVCQDLLQ